MTDWATISWNLAIGVLVGVAANFVYDYILPAKLRQRAWPRLPSLWSVVVLVYAVGLLYLVEERWVVPFHTRIVVVVVGLVGIVLVTLVVQLPKRRPWEKLLIAAILPLFLVAAVDRLFPRWIRLECPELVGDEAVFKGQVAREHWKVNVLVHPFRTPEWWVQQVPLPDRHGNWEARVVFGGESGDRFEVLAIAIPEGAFYREGEVLRSDQIPVVAMKSRICEVEKR
jgi:hypothetical protein